MGSFNQRCILTHSPIGYNDKVYMGQTLTNVPARGERLVPHEVQFGLPMRASYDDYGNANITSDLQYEFHEAAWEQQNYFKPLTSTDSRDNFYIAADERALDFLDYGVARLLGDPATYGAPRNPHGISEERQQAHVQANQGLKELGRRLAQTDTTKINALEQVYQHVRDVFDDTHAIAVWNYLRHHGMLVERKHWMINEAAFKEVVALGNDKLVGSKKTLREKIAAQLEKEFSRTPSKFDYLFDRGPEALTIWGNKETTWVKKMFLGGLDDQTALAVYGFEHILDVQVFYQTINLFHISLTHFDGAGQDYAWKQWQRVQQAVVDSRSRRGGGGFPKEYLF